MDIHDRLMEAVHENQRSDGELLPLGALLLDAEIKIMRLEVENRLLKKRIKLVIDFLNNE